MAIMGEVEKIRNDLVDERIATFTANKTDDRWRARETAHFSPRGASFLRRFLCEDPPLFINQRDKIEIPRTPSPSSYL